MPNNAMRTSNVPAHASAVEEPSPRSTAHYVMLSAFDEGFLIDLRSACDAL